MGQHSQYTFYYGIYENHYCDFLACTQTCDRLKKLQAQQSKTTQFQHRE